MQDQLVDLAVIAFFERNLSVHHFVEELGLRFGEDLELLLVGGLGH